MKTVLKLAKLKLSRLFRQTVARDVIVTMERRRMIRMDCSFRVCTIVAFLVGFDCEGHTFDGK